MSDEVEEFEEPREEAATNAVYDALVSADYDEVQGVVIVPDSTGDHRMAHYCRTLVELRNTLEGLYDDQWYGNVPFDGGEARYQGDAVGCVNAHLVAEEIQNFFAQFGREPEGDRIITAEQTCSLRVHQRCFALTWRMSTTS